MYQSKKVLPYLWPQCSHCSWINTGINDPYSDVEQAKKKDEWARLSDIRKELKTDKSGEKFDVVFWYCCSLVELDAISYRTTRGFIFYTGKFWWFCWLLSLNYYELSAVSETQGHHFALCSWPMNAFITWQFSFRIAAIPFPQLSHFPGSVASHCNNCYSSAKAEESRLWSLFRTDRRIIPTLQHLCL